MELPANAECNNISPYLYEPECGTCVSSSNSSEGETDEELDVEEQVLGPEPSNWCQCGKCVQTTVIESVCCCSIDLVQARMMEQQVSCISDHEGFKSNCLNHWVIETSFFEYLQREGPPLEDTPMNETYRYVSYRRFARFIWKHLPKHSRKVLPLCVVNAIRQAFPSEEYCGFKYASV
ncbi:P2X purinoceptor 7-like [Mya arenaria]|uniref:P2X purinoceptor 7-like n=1 Tax=Mya arenaria TaxID=6604 RepID=UPI0022E3D79D|nr:P2X purinoceptor 7-like [Mya arenaria]